MSIWQKLLAVKTYVSRGRSVIDTWTVLGLVALIIVGGTGAMVIMSLQVDPILGQVTAERAEIKYFVTMYQASDYGAGCNYDGNPFVYDFVNYEGESLDLTLTPKVLAIDSVYLMRISQIYYASDGTTGIYGVNFGKFMRDPSQDVIKIAEYDLPANIISLEIYIPENNIARSSWWLVCFCADMGYRGTPENNPDGKVIIDIVVI